jgi:hypothetical protein
MSPAEALPARVVINNAVVSRVMAIHLDERLIN